MKQMILKYSGNCVNCGDRIPAGTMAIYNGRGRGVEHIDCNSDNENYTTRDGQSPRVSYFTTSGGTFSRCNCEDYPCCGH